MKINVRTVQLVQHSAVPINSLALLIMTVEAMMSSSMSRSFCLRLMPISSTALAINCSTFLLEKKNFKNRQTNNRKTTTTKIKKKIDFNYFSNNREK